MPDPPPIAGLRFRRVDLDADVDGLVALINESSIVDGTEMAFSADEVRHDLTHKANFDIDRDVVVAELDGRLVGEVEVNVVVRDGIAVHSFVGWVHPDARRRGIGRSLARWVEQRSREVAATWPGSEPHELGAWVDSNGADGLALLESLGYRRSPLRLPDDPAAVGADPGRAAARRARDPAGRRGRPSADLGRRYGGVPRPPGVRGADRGALPELVHDAEPRHEPVARGLGRRRGRGIDLGARLGPRRTRSWAWAGAGSSTSRSGGRGGSAASRRR